MLIPFEINTKLYNQGWSQTKKSLFMLGNFNNRVLQKMFFSRSALISYNFAKIIKLTPKQNQQNVDESISKSITSAMSMFKQFSSNNSSFKQQKQTTSPQTQSKHQQFINFITTINPQLFQSKIMSPQQKAGTILKRIKSQNILSNAVQILISQKSFSLRQKKYITNLFSLMSLLFKKNILQGRKGEMDLQFFKQFMQQFNQYMILMQMRQKLLMNYLFLTNHLIKTKTVDSSRAYFVNQKIVIDYVLQNKQKFNINSKFELLPLFNYLSLGNVIANYPQRYFEFVEFLLKKLDNRWEQMTYFRNKRFVQALYNLSYRTDKIMNGMKEIIKTENINQQNFDVIVTALNAYINLKADMYVQGRKCPQQILSAMKRISTFIKSIKQKSSSKPQKHITTTTNNNNNNNKHQPHQFIKPTTISDDDIQLQIYRTLIPTMFRCSIWMQEIWLQFAQWLDREKNYQKLPIIQIYTIMDLLEIDNDIIPAIVSQRLLQSKQHMLLKNNFRIEDVDLIKVYHRQFGQRMRAFYTSQQQIANNLRSVSKINIKTQSLIRFFLVDILMNNDTIIEINNQMHYIMDEGQTNKVANVKSAFRKRILQKLGYKFMQFEVDTFVQGNYEFLKLVEKQFNLHQQQVEKQSLTL